jgi:hypothetical protein
MYKKKVQLKRRRMKCPAWFIYFVQPLDYEIYMCLIGEYQATRLLSQTQGGESDYCHTENAKSYV